MRIVLFIIGLAFSAIGLFFGATVSMGAGEAIDVAIGILFILWSVFYDAAKKNRALKIFKGIFVFFMIITTLYSCAVCVAGRMDNASYNEDYIIVLGAGLNGSEPSLALRERLDKAVEYMNRNTEAEAIVTGGQGRGEMMSEAEAMSDYLVSHGIDEKRIIKEENAESTYQNFEYAKLEMEEGGTAVFVTNDFHVVRSLQMARMHGIDAAHIGAPTSLKLLPVSCVREFIAQLAVIRYYF